MTRVDRDSRLLFATNDTERGGHDAGVPFARERRGQDPPVPEKAGQGRPNDELIDNVASKATSKFVLKNGVLRYRNLAFNVEGATVKLDGTHGLTSKALALEGEVLLQSSASNTLTGFKRWLVKPFDALLRNHGAGTRLVIRVEGTQDQPKVALEIGKTLRGR